MRFRRLAILVTLVLVACAGPTAPTVSPAASLAASSRAPTALASPVIASATLMPSPSASPSGGLLVSCPNPDGGSCLGQLSPGTYASQAFQPRITYVVPAGWGNFEDLPGNFLLLPPGALPAGVDAGTADYIGVYTHVLAETATCAGPPSDADSSPEGIGKWLAGQRDLAVTKPMMVSIGGLDGEVLDIKLAKGFKPVVDWWAGRCVIMGFTPSGLEHGVGPGVTMRLYLLGSPDSPGATLAIEVDDVTSANHLDEYSKIIEGFRFAK